MTAAVVNIELLCNAIFFRMSNPLSTSQNASSTTTATANTTTTPSTGTTTAPTAAQQNLINQMMQSLATGAGQRQVRLISFGFDRLNDSVATEQLPSRPVAELPVWPAPCIFFL